MLVERIPLVSLLASCEMHALKPLGYLRDLLRLLPSWPVQQVIGLAPLHWAKTVQRADVQQQLEENTFRRAALGTLQPLPRAAPPIKH